VTPDQLPDWNDPRVQTVYALVSDPDSMPPDGEHWDGWVSKRIVAALAASPPAPATPTQPLGAPASPSGSPLQPPAAASAAIPSANAQRAYDPILGVWTSAAAQAEQREQARIDRVVGGLEAAKSASYSPADRAFHSFWYGHMVNDRMTAPLDRISYGVARYVWEAARGMEARRAETAGLGSAGPTARSPNGDAPEREAAP
jgi:hypothetical protein